MQTAPRVLELRKQVEKTVADLNKEQRATIRTAEEFETLLRDPRWLFYQKVLEESVALARQQGEGDRLPDEDGMAFALRMERQKGTIIGLRLALEHPSIMIRVGNELRNRLLGAGKETTK